jgi:NodT family efflux transporter outer membrane factor (OMF) lipoprotein
MRVTICLGLAAIALPCAALARTEPSLPVIELPATYSSPKGGAALPPAALDHWWTQFHDHTLDALEDEALRSAPDARTASARLVEARATRTAQTAATLPSGSIGANASRQKDYEIGAPTDRLNPTSGITDSVTGSFNVSWEIDLFGRLAVARRIANADAAEARFNVEGLYASLAADVADAYFQTRGLVVRLEDARQTARIARDLLDAARRRAEAGSGPADAIDRVAGQVAQAEAQVADLSAQLASSRRGLLILVGRNLTAVETLDLPGDPPSVPDAPVAVPSELLARRPDIREAEYRLRAELGVARLAHLAIFPKLTLFPGLGLSSTASPGVSYIPPSTLVTTQQVTTSGFWNLAAGVSAPTFDIPKLLQQARAEDARARQAAIAYERTVRSAFGEAQSAFGDLAAGERAVTLLADGEARARLAYDAARRRYAGGVDDIDAALNAERDWRAVRSDLTAERVDTLRRAVRTYKALGGGWVFSSGNGGA